MDVTQIREIVEGGLGWKFMAQAPGLANARADSAPFPLVYFEVYRVGRIEARPRWVVTEEVELYFMDLAPDPAGKGRASKSAIDMEGDTILEVQARLMEAARLFVRTWNNAHRHRALTNLEYEYPPPMFDANEVSLCLRFKVKEEPQCL